MKNKNPDAIEVLRSVVREMRFELTWVAPYAPQTYAYTNSAIPAACSIIVRKKKLINGFEQALFWRDEI